MTMNNEKAVEGTIENPVIGSIIYFDRKWLFPIDDINNSFCSVKLDTDKEYASAEVVISDGSTPSHLYFDYEGMEALANSTAALDTLIAMLTDLKDKMVSDFGRGQQEPQDVLAGETEALGFNDETHVMWANHKALK